MARSKRQWVLEQGAFVPLVQRHEECLLELTIPLTADSTGFRVGWSLKGLKRSGWIAITTGRQEWSRDDLPSAAAHITHLLEAICDLLEENVTPPRDC